jgi:O-antigen ligase
MSNASNDGKREAFRFQFSLASILIGTALLAVCCAAMVFSLWLAAALLIIATLLFVRIHMRCGPPRQLPWRGRGAQMLGLVIMLLLCCPIAFLATCFVGGVGASELTATNFNRDFNDIFAIGIVLGSVASLQTAELLFRVCGSSKELDA